MAPLSLTATPAHSTSNWSVHSSSSASSSCTPSTSATATDAPGLALQLRLSAPVEHVDTSPLVLSVGVVGIGGSGVECPGYEPMSPNWDLWWSLGNDTASGPGPGAAPAPDPNSSALEWGFTPPPLGTGRRGRVAVVPASLLKGDWQKVTVVARAKASQETEWQTRTAVIHVWHTPLCEAATVTLEGVCVCVCLCLCTCVCVCVVLVPVCSLLMLYCLCAVERRLIAVWSCSDFSW